MDDKRNIERGLGDNVDVTEEQLASRMTHEHFFGTALENLKKDNWKIKSIIKSLGSYDALPDSLKKLIDRKLGVRRITVLVKIEETDDTDRKQGN